MLEIERPLWTNDAALYQQHLIDGALLVFPETGVITREVAVDAIRAENSAGRRWAEVTFTHPRSLPLDDAAAVPADATRCGDIGAVSARAG